MDKNSKKIVIVLVVIISVICLLCFCCTLAIFWLSNNTSGHQYEDLAKRNASSILAYMYDDDEIEKFVKNMPSKYYSFSYYENGTNGVYNSASWDDSYYEAINLIKIVANSIDIKQVSKYEIKTVEYGTVSEFTPTEKVIYKLTYKDKSTRTFSIKFDSNPANYNVDFEWDPQRTTN